MSDIGQVPNLSDRAHRQFLQRLKEAVERGAKAATTAASAGAQVVQTAAAVWGRIGGTLANQSDLQAALDAKADATALSGKIDEAPNNGTKYARKNKSWVPVSDGGGTWGSITGTLSDQDDLQSALDAKLDTSDVDDDDTLAADSSTLVPSQHAVRTFVGDEIAAAVGGGGYIPLQKDLNLADLDDAEEARENLGLGTAATADAESFAVVTKVMPCSEDLSAGDFVSVYNDGGTQKARKADATEEGKEADGFVTDDFASGASAVVKTGGINSALSDLTPGARYYLSTTAGQVTTTAPTSAIGNVVQYIGSALSTTELVFVRSDGIIIGTASP